MSMYGKNHYNIVNNQPLTNKNKWKKIKKRERKLKERQSVKT